MNDEARVPINRMFIAALALIGILVAAYMSLYKFGYIGMLACGAGSCETVQASKWSSFMGVPVPLIGLLGYLAVMIVAILGLQPAWQESRPVSLLLLALTTVAFVFSVYLSYLEQFVIHAWCRWCIGSAVIATLAWLFALVEVPRLRRRA